MYIVITICGIYGLSGFCDLRCPNFDKCPYREKE